MENLIIDLIKNMNVIELCLLFGVWFQCRKQIKEVKCWIYHQIEECKEK